MKTFKQTKLKELETILDRFFERIIDRNTAIDQILVILSSTIDEAVDGIIGEDELKLKAGDEWDSYENDKIAARNNLRAEQRAKLGGVKE
jgi:hypothetical protein